MTLNEIATHRTHCCRFHGCKYGYYIKCPVVNGEVLQDYLCEDCEGDGITDELLDKAQELKINDFSLQEDELSVLLVLSKGFPQLLLKLEALKNKKQK